MAFVLFSLVSPLTNSILAKQPVPIPTPKPVDPTWTGGGASTNWSDNSNWSGGTPAGTYGTLTFNTGGTQGTTSTDDESVNQNELNWTGSLSWTLNNSNSAVISLFDFSGTQAKVENDSSGLVTINANITFAATAGAAWGEINAVDGNLTFGTGTLTVNGSQVAGIRMFGAGHTTTFNNTVSASGKYFDTTSASGDTIAIGGTFTSDNFYLMNGSILNLSSSNFTTTGLRLGGDFSTSGAQNLGLGATFNLTPAAGGVTFASTINSVTGNTSGALTVNSQNTSGTNTLSGHIALDSALFINQSGGGTLDITQVQGANTTTGTDIKAQTLTFGGAGNITHTGTIYNSTGSGKVAYSGTGTLTLGGTNTYSGETDINSGTVVLVNNSGAGTGTIFIGNGGATSTAATLDLGSTTGGLNVSNALTENTGSTGNRTIGATNTSGTNTYSGTLTLNDSNATLAAATGGTVAFNTITASSTQTVAVGGNGNNGNVQLTGTSDNVNLGATVNSGTLTLAKTSSSTVHAIGSSLTVNSGGTVILTGSGGDQIFNSATVTLNGGTFQPNAHSEGTGSNSLAGVVVTGTSANGMGALTLQNNSTLDYGTSGVATLTFASFSPTAGKILDILNYTNTDANIATQKSGIDGTDDRLIFDQNESSNLGSFSFNGVSAMEIALGDGFFEIVPVPEPGTWAAGALAFSALLVSQRRRFFRFVRRG